MSQIYLRQSDTNDSTSLLSADSQTYAELISVSPDFYNFSFTFKVKLSNGNKNIKDYEKVVVTVKSKNRPVPGNLSNLLTEKSNKTANTLDPVSLQDYVKPDNDKKAKLISDKISEKLFSGLKIVKDSERQESFIERKDIFLSPYIEQAYTNRYTYTELVALEYTQIKEFNRTREAKLNVGSTQVNELDPHNLLHRINQEVLDITLPITDPRLCFLTSESLIDGTNFRTQIACEGKPPLYFDIMKFYLDKVKSSPEESKMKSYTTKKVVKNLESIEIKQEVLIGPPNKNDTYLVQFDLYKKSSLQPDETLTQDLYVQPHVEAYESIIDYPMVSCTKLTFSDGTLDKTSKNSYSVIISDQDKSGKVDSFNLYLKDIQSSGQVTDYILLRKIKNYGVVETIVETSCNLSCLRVVPVDSFGRESNTFTSLIIGEGHSVLGSLVCIPYHYGLNQIKVDILGIPNKTLSISLFKRDCTENPNSEFSIMSSVRMQKGVNSITVSDNDVVLSRAYEYYAIAIVQDQNDTRETTMESNYSMIRSLSNGIPEKPINVFFSNDSVKKSTDGRIEVSFFLKTEITPTENERITSTLKEQIGELYEQFLNPLANSSSPLGDDKGVPKYADLLLHEVIRYNLSTGERETFDLISDGEFKDNIDTQKLSNVRPINPYHDYEYKVFTFRKNPIELFKNFVAKGTDGKSKKSEWFYYPYKWRNPSEKLGKLYPQDEKGQVVIDSYDNFTSECYGLTSSYRVSSYAKLPVIERVNADRIDRNTVKVSWHQDNSMEYQSEKYDCFVVLKVVNRVKSFVGRTISNFIYHELSEKDLGTVYYIVVPITSKYSIDTAYYSNSVFISPDGLIQKIKVPSASIYMNTTNS